jgi:BirA family biotin operon repressor/biotin-[acetyl-CoA-carboxylase] ligase
LVREAMAQHGTVVFAHDQTNGKGQRNRQWASERNQNIALSAVIEPETLNCSRLFLLSMTIATAVHSFFKTYVKDDLKIKWPNDIYWNDRKAAGVLIENVWQGNEWKYAVAGIGININQTDFGELASKAVSLRLITGKQYEPLALAKEVCSETNKYLNKLHTQPELIIAEYRDNLYKLNEAVKFKKGNRIFEAVIKDVDIDGGLVVEHALEEKFEVGEIEWIK